MRHHTHDSFKQQVSLAINSRWRALSSAFTLSLFFTIALMVCLYGMQSIHAQEAAQARPPCKKSTGTIRTDRCQYTEAPWPSPSPSPALNQKFTDPNFGVQILRATGEEDGTQLGTFYSHWPTFNSNNTYILIKKEGGNALLKHFNATTFTVDSPELLPSRIVIGSADYGTVTWESAIWHPTIPNLIYCFPAAPNGNVRGMALFTYNISGTPGQRFQRIKDFNEYSGGNTDYLHQMSMGWDGSVGADGKPLLTFAWTQVRCSLLSGVEPAP
jgi:hypothetical protein